MIDYESSRFYESDSDYNSYLLSDQHDEEFEFDEEEVTIETFGSVVSKVFHRSHKSISAVFSEIPARDIIELEKSTIVMLEIITAINKVMDVSMATASRALLRELQGCYGFKMFIAADDEDLFTSYPEHAIYHQQYLVSSFNLTVAIQAKIPHFQLQFNGIIAISLEQSIAAFVQHAGTDADKWNMDDFSSLVDQWEGKTDKEECRLSQENNTTYSVTGTLNLISVPNKDKAYKKISTLGKI